MMSTWVISLLMASTMWVAHVVFIKMAVAKMPTVVLVFSYYGVAFLTAAILLFVQKPTVDVSAFLQDRGLVVAVLLAGVTIVLTDYFVARGLSLGGPLSLYMPLFTTISITLIALVGFLFFQETMTWSRLVGLLLSCLGIFLLTR
jgi:drug/metabolite transporter (DMT)-like permease